MDLSKKGKIGLSMPNQLMYINILYQYRKKYINISIDAVKAERQEQNKKPLKLTLRSQRFQIKVWIS